MAVLKYKGEAAYTDPSPAPRFVAHQGDLVEFTSEEAQQKLDQEPELWTKEVTKRGTKR